MAGSPGSAGELWADFARDVAALPEIVTAGAPEGLEADGLRYMLRYLAAGISTCVEFDDTNHPELGSLIENRRSWGLDNPDTKYSFTRLSPGATYRVAGDAGTALELEAQVDTGHFADGRFAEWNCLRRWRRGEATLPVDGSGSVSFEFTAPDRASYLHVREYFGDWVAERPALLAVERVGAPLPARPPGMDEMAARMELLGQWLTAGARCWAELGSGLASAEPGDITPLVPPAGATGLGGQAYGMGGFRCGDDEAVLLEFEPPQCRYWSVSLATWFWESPDIADTQCSLNHTQAVAGDTVRIVLCQQDPGFANWLDPSGHTQGTIAFRLLDAEALPTLRYRTVPVEHVEDEVPHEAQVAPGERSEILRRRRDSIVRRYRR